MEVILLKNLDKVGAEGEVIRVKDGYARNYLIPKKLAVICTKEALKNLELKRKKKALLAEKEKRSAQELAKRIASISLTIPVESGAGEKLFGSVTAEMIFHALQQEGVDIDKRNINIKDPISQLGIYSVEVKLHPEVKENLRIWVVKK